MPFLSPNHPNAPKQVKADIRGIRALELRAEGMGYRKIAERLTAEGDPCNPNAAYEALKRARKTQREHFSELARDVCDLELERLDRMLVGVWPNAEAGDTKAIDAVIRLMDRRARYLGLDRPGQWPEGSSGEPEAPGLNVSVLSDVELEQLSKMMERVRGE